MGISGFQDAVPSVDVYCGSTVMKHLAQLTKTRISAHAI
jgi:hypothetical protein